MTKATKPLSNRIAVVFDFDDTLVPDTLDGLAEHYGIGAEELRQRVEPLLEEGWEKIPARFHCLIEESKRRNDPKDKLTKEYLANFGRELEPFEGVPEMFDRLRRCACDLVPDIEVEFYLITGGIVEIARHTRIADHFKALWGCEFHYDQSGEVQFLKRSVSHTEKTRYLFQIAKGIEEQQDGELFVYRDVPPEELHVPLTQMIYVGDGTSDIPCFSVLNDEQGVAIGVNKMPSAAEWASKSSITQNQRVANLVPADYREDSEMMQSLMLAVENTCKQIALRQLSVGE